MMSTIGTGTPAPGILMALAALENTPLAAAQPYFVAELAQSYSTATGFQAKLAGTAGSSYQIWSQRTSQTGAR